MYVGYVLRRWPARRTALLLICAAVFISYIDRTNISVAAVAMRQAFGWSETQKGLVLSAFYIGYIAPCYADVIYGISNTFAALPGIAGVFLTGWMVDRTGSFVAPFFLTAAVSLVGAVVFLVFASGKHQID